MTIADRIKKLEESIKFLEIRLTQNRASNQAKTFDSLNDTPANKTGSGEEFVIVNTGATALEYKAGCYDYDCKIYLNNNQLNIASGANVLVLLDAIDVNVGSMADIANNKITTVVAGKYMITCSIKWNVTVLNAQYFSWPQVDGIAMTPANHPSSYAGNSRQGIAFVVDIGAGKDIKAYCRQESGVNTPDIIAGQYDCYLRVTLLREL